MCKTMFAPLEEKMAILSVEINCFICTSLAFKGTVAIDLCRNSSLSDAIDLMLKIQLALCFFKFLSL